MMGERVELRSSIRCFVLDFNSSLIFKDLTYKVLSKDFNTFYLNITVDPHYPITNFEAPKIPVEGKSQNETEEI